jgi:hypothetical protein
MSNDATYDMIMAGKNVRCLTSAPFQNDPEEQPQPKTRALASPEDSLPEFSVDVDRKKGTVSGGDLRSLAQPPAPDRELGDMPISDLMTPAHMIQAARGEREAAALVAARAAQHPELPFTPVIVDRKKRTVTRGDP